ncbi:MAG: hypothetical protein NTZ05_10945, partial [Chloroflexi bacterium]|nr:hypothetical protein [Chloroflexota bacterium]
MRFLPMVWRWSGRRKRSTPVALSPGLRRLKWLTILAPPAALLLVDLMRQRLAPDMINVWPGQVLISGVALVGSLVFSETIFGIFERMQRRLTQQNHELLALHDAGLDIAGELGLETVLQKVVENARRLIGSRYGALGLLHDNGSIQTFLTSGMSAEERDAIGPPPTGHGLL